MLAAQIAEKCPQALYFADYRGRGNIAFGQRGRPGADINCADAFGPVVGMAERSGDETAEFLYVAALGGNRVRRAGLFGNKIIVERVVWHRQ